jgi:hypothetical protein
MPNEDLETLRRIEKKLDLLLEKQPTVEFWEQWLRALRNRLDAIKDKLEKD